MTDRCLKCGSNRRETLDIAFGETRGARDRPYYAFDCNSKWWPENARNDEFEESPDCLKRQLAQAKAENARLRVALLPFAEHYARIDFWPTDKVASYCQGGQVYWIRLAELRGANEAAKEKQE